MKQFDIVTIFPGMFTSYFGESIIKRSAAKKLIDIRVHDLRRWARDKHRKVDDTPYGGGAGMVMKVEPIYEAVKKIRSGSRKKKCRVVLFSAKGKRYVQKDARRLARYDQLILICGRYEGVDERVAENIADEEISLGDFVLTGGEIPAMAVVDSVTRLIPGSLGNAESAEFESHSQEGYLEYPQYTKPENFKKMGVPEILLSGNHRLIAEWRRKKSKQR